jgi:DNA-binding SARP family transcriptional activator/tetratricopeptide (TPR) repeat protein
MIDFRLLGPFGLWVDGQELNIGPARQRCVLAVLLATKGSPVTPDALIDRVWGESPPSHAHALLYTYLSRLRGVLAPAEVRLVRSRAGYVGEVPPSSVDANRFAGYTAQAGREPRAEIRVDLLRRGLALWRGVPLGGLSGDWVERTRHTLREQQIATLNQLFGLELRLGRHEEVIGELSQLVDDDPTIEPLVRHLMLALHRCGRDTDALEAFRRTRVAVVRRYGVEPGRDLREMQRAVLAHEPRLELPQTVRNGDSWRPAQLPSEVHGFTARATELKELMAMADAPDSPRVTVISGTAGIGKTSLAVSWAHRVADRFPDGQLYVDLRGFDSQRRRMDPAEAVRSFLEALDVTPDRIPVGYTAQVALYRSVVAGRRVLVVLDNAGDTGQIRDLVPGTPDSRTVVTSRYRLPGLVAMAAAHTIALQPFTPLESLQLLTRRLGADRLAAEPAAIDEIITRCGGLPLALAIVAAQASTRPESALTRFVRQPGETANGLDGFCDQDPATDLRSVFSWSYRELSEPAARMFRLFGVHPGPDTSLAGAASLAGVSGAQAADLLDELCGAHLLTEPATGRYAMHLLLRAYATELSVDEADAARMRIMDHYLHSAFSAAIKLSPLRSPIDLPALHEGAAPEEFADQEEARRWFVMEHHVLLASVDAADAADLDGHIWRLAWSLAVFQQTLGHWAQWAAVQEKALRATRRLGDRPGEQRTLRGLAKCSIQAGDFDAAEAYLDRALRLADEDADLTGQAHTLSLQAWLRGQQDRIEDAIAAAESALSLYEAVQNRCGIADVLNILGWYHAQLGDTDLGLAYCHRSLAEHRKIGHTIGAAAALDSLAVIHVKLGDGAAAVQAYSQALALFREQQDRYQEATTLADIGDTYQTFGDAEAAIDSWRSAVAILDELDHPAAEKVRAKIDAGPSRPAIQGFR